MRPQLRAWFGSCCCARPWWQESLSTARGKGSCPICSQELAGASKGCSLTVTMAQSVGRHRTPEAQASTAIVARRQYLNVVVRAYLPALVGFGANSGHIYRCDRYLETDSWAIYAASGRSALLVWPRDIRSSDPARTATSGACGASWTRAAVGFRKLISRAGTLAHQPPSLASGA
jgi:hypothetical protein